MTSPEQDAVAARLAEGVSRLEPLLRPNGFALAESEAGKGSGGYFASADFVKADRQLHLWLRFHSLSVRYELRGHALEHASYMRELLGPNGGNRFPSYSENTQAAFSALHHDLTQFCGDFLSGTGEGFMRCWASAQEDAQRSPFARLDRTEDQLKDN